MIKIYGNPRCVFCLKAKELADRNNLEYQWLNTDEPNILAELKAAKPNVKTIPQIWWGEKYIGGYNHFVDVVGERNELS